jgi:orotate phosphoribosyltransferase
MPEENLQGLKARLLALLKEKALQRGKFILSSGKESGYYLDARVITLTPEGAYLAASIILQMIEGQGVTAIGGPTLGADPIAGAVGALSHQKNIPLKTFIVRKAVKGHGTQKQIEGPELKPGERAVLVDDVATTGGAILEAKEALEKIGVKVLKAIVIVDREEGAAGNLAVAGLKLEAVFSRSDIIG